MTTYGIYAHASISYDGTAGPTIANATIWGYWKAFSLSTNTPDALNFVHDNTEVGPSGSKLIFVNTTVTSTIIGTSDQEIRTDSGWKSMGSVTTSDKILMSDYNSSTGTYFWPVFHVSTLTGTDLQNAETRLVEHSGQYEPGTIWARNDYATSYFCMRTYPAN